MNYDFLIFSIDGCLKFYTNIYFLFIFAYFAYVFETGYEFVCYVSSKNYSFDTKLEDLSLLDIDLSTYEAGLIFLTFIELISNRLAGYAEYLTSNLLSVIIT